MKKNKNVEDNFRFNGSKINSTKEIFPSTIDWNTLQRKIIDVFEKKDNRSIWGKVNDQQNKK